MESTQAVPAAVALPSEILTVDELATRLHVTRDYVLSLTRARARQTNPIPVIKPTPQVLLFDWKQVQVWLATKTDAQAGRKPRAYRRQRKTRKAA